MEYNIISNIMKNETHNIRGRVGKEFNHQITHYEYIVISSDHFLSTQLTLLSLMK